MNVNDFNHEAKMFCKIEKYARRTNTKIILYKG